MKSRELVERWVAGVSEALNPGRLLVETLRREKSEDPLDSPGAAVLAIGKAAHSMATAERAWATDRWGRLALERPTLVVSPCTPGAEDLHGRFESSVQPATGVRNIPGNHPQPGE